jgi:ribonuclease E
MGEQPPVLGHDMVPEAAIAASADNEDGSDDDDAELTPEQAAVGGEESEANRRRRRRGRRGGRRRRHGDRDAQGNPLPGADGDIRHPPQPRDFDHDRNLDARPVQHDNRDPVDPMPTDERHDQAPAASAPELNYYRPAEIAQPAENAIEHRSQPDVAVEPSPAAETVDAAPSGPPRRGWWQRLTTRE